ncbi:hypothetical protein RISK_000719 [Rhodopirellula islandica]|uniref:SGNH hydrolase-type esterase domain-containing protein n=2 Tax=Rhodopirellula islandica TaxID=595434 RepID=A0A0J1BKI5_RHOIS|nr:hypothetical protein RISK_000719 [Rhodopirellula islandica]
MKGQSPMRLPCSSWCSFVAPLWVGVFLVAIAGSPQNAHAVHDGMHQVLLLGDSTTEGSVPRRLKPEGPHLERVLEQLLAAEEGLPPFQVTNSSQGGETIRRLLDSGRYERNGADLPGLDYIFIRYGINDRAKIENFVENFPKHFAELCERLRSDHPNAELIAMTVIPFSSEEASEEINGLIRNAAAKAGIDVFDIYPRYKDELSKGPNALNYRRYDLGKVPTKYLELVEPFVHGDRVEVMGNELDAILGGLPGWYSDRHPNLAGYNVIADETAKYLARRLREKAN